MCRVADDELVVVEVDDPGGVLLVQLDRADDVSGVFVPGSGGATPADITAAIEAHRADPEAHYQYLRWEDGDNRYVQQPVLDAYATKEYVDLQVATGGDLGAVQELIDTSVAGHVQAAEPHPAYDTDAPTFSLIFQNGLV
jgi:hypothetical protein